MLTIARIRGHEDDTYIVTGETQKTLFYDFGMTLGYAGYISIARAEAHELLNAEQQLALATILTCLPVEVLRTQTLQIVNPHTQEVVETWVFPTSESTHCDALEDPHTGQ